MSAPDSDPRKQAYQHRGPLRGMFLVVLFAIVLLGITALFVFSRGGNPEGSEAQVEGTTGQVQGSAEGSPTANDNPSDDAQAGAGEPDPNAVTVAPETVTAPEVGTGNPPDTDPGESQSAEPAGSAEGTTGETANE